MKCPYCGKPPKLVPGSVIYPHRRDVSHKWFYLCKPCDAYVGTHSNSATFAPLGRLADYELRQAKKLAHAVFDPLWKSGAMTRRAAYLWLADALGLPKKKTHIGMFDVEMCNAVIAAVRART